MMTTKIKITLVDTWANKGTFFQTWEVNGERHRTVSEHRDIEFDEESEIDIVDGITPADVIGLAISTGHGPTLDGESTEWDYEELKTLLHKSGPASV